MCFDNLVKLGMEFDACMIEVMALNGPIPVGESEAAFEQRAEQLFQRRDALIEKIIAAPAFTREHVAIKARVAQAVGFGELSDGIEMRAIKSLIVAVSDAES